MFLGIVHGCMKAYCPAVCRPTAYLYSGLLPDCIQAYCLIVCRPTAYLYSGLLPDCIQAYCLIVCMPTACVYSGLLSACTVRLVCLYLSGLIDSWKMKLAPETRRVPLPPLRHRGGEEFPQRGARGPISHCGLLSD
jgi:hypothetical protein